MKIIATFLLLSSLANAADFLSVREERVILRSIDMICGDTWCESDYNFHFNKLSCNTNNKSCILDFDFVLWPDEDLPAPTPNPAKCEIEKVASYSDFVDSREHLNDGVYDQISDCINNLFD